LNVHVYLIALGLLTLGLTGCIKEERQISYAQHVQPILHAYCIECHSPHKGQGYLETGLIMTSHETLMQGTWYGPVIVPGDSRHSILNMLVEGRSDPSMRMPHGREPLGSADIRILRLWVDQGAVND
jgi:hypothetical protein